MRVLGIDPGLVNMGWGVIHVDGSRLSHVANGVCKSGKGDLAVRLLALHDQLEAVIALFFLFVKHSLAQNANTRLALSTF